MARAERRTFGRNGRRRWPIALATILLFAAGLAAIVVWTHPQESRQMVTKLRHRVAAPLLAVLAGAAPAQPTATGPVPPTTIGVNLSSLAYHLNSRAFANLLIGTDWVMIGPGGVRGDVPPAMLSRQGLPLAMPAGATTLMLPVQRSETGPGGVTIRCTWTGTADIGLEGGATDVRTGDHQLEFRRTIDWANSRSIRLKVTRLSAADPLKMLDCRETTIPRAARFDPRFVAFARQFKLLRFMDWQATNDNKPVRWDGRAIPGDLPYRQAGGVAVEDMMSLVRDSGSDAWFTIPWNADDDYITRFATYVRDNLPAGQRVYVEMSNEVWNSGFDVNRQAAAEGGARGLADNAIEAAAYRYAERAGGAMDIWTQVFAKRPKSLVRVLAAMHWSGKSVDRLLTYKDTATRFDALATAPYFAPEIAKQPKPKTLDEAFAHLDEAVDLAINRAAKHKASAQAHGLRYIAYEGGQHIVLHKDKPLMAQINRDPRMYDAYKRFLTGWKARIGDAFVHYASVQIPSRGGAWGLAEHPGQPVSAAPKLRAVLEAR
jgi:hypothetical protein